MRPHFKSAGIALAILLGVQVAPLVTLRESGIAGQQPATAQMIQDRKAEADRLNQEGSRLNEQNQYQAALEKYQAAIAIAREIQARQLESKILLNLGEVYSLLGGCNKALDLELCFKALELSQQALAISREIGDRVGEADSLHIIGAYYTSLWEAQKALEVLQEALDIRREIGDRTGEAAILNSIGMNYGNLGEPQKAVEVLQEALIIYQELGFRVGERATLHNIGTLYFASIGDNLKALEFYQRALSIQQELGESYSYGTLIGIGYALVAQQQPELAIVFFKEVVNIDEAVRANNRNLPKEYQDAYTQRVAGHYRKLADLLLQEDRVLEAQQVLDLLKIQELNDYLRNVRGNAQTAQGVEVLKPETEILKKYDLLQAQAVKLGKELTSLRQIPEAQRTPVQQQRIAQLVQLETDLNRQFNQFLESDDIQALVDQLSRTTRRQSVNLEDLNTLRNDLKQVGNGVLLYPLILDDRLELIITTPDAPPLRRTVKVTREELNKTIVEFRLAITDESVDPQPAAQRLYDLLIKPIEQDLQASNAQTILYAPDGQLRYVPIAALYDGKQWLAERYRVNNITARSLTDFTSKPSQQIRILAGAFVKGSYSFQVGERSFALGGLPFAGKEVQQLAALLPNTRTLVDQNFSRQQILPQLGEATIVHLATHASFVAGQPEESFILLGNGDRLNLREVQDLSLQNVDLVVLSACQTGVGGILGNGEEILGLGYQFQRAGAKATIASLWFVNDQSTQQLMQVFYENLKQGKSKAEALQGAQQALINAGGEFDHPLYWAPFILIGNGL